MKRLRPVFNFACGAVVAFMLFLPFAFRSKANNKVRAETAIEWRAPQIPEQLSFAGEAVPLERWDVRERLDRELLLNVYNQANILYLLKLSNRYFPLISERLKEDDVPDDFKYLCIAESNLQSGALSRSGAVGFWQFMNGTASGFGLETSSLVDERMDIQKSTDAACKYLKQAYAKFGNGQRPPLRTTVAKAATADRQRFSTPLIITTCNCPKKPTVISTAFLLLNTFWKTRSCLVSK